jgi:hypothetical protein
MHPLRDDDLRRLGSNQSRDPHAQIGFMGHHPRRGDGRIALACDAETVPTRSGHVLRRNASELPAEAFAAGMAAQELSTCINKGHWWRLRPYPPRHRGWPARCWPRSQGET